MRVCVETLEEPEARLLAACLTAAAAASSQPSWTGRDGTGRGILPSTITTTTGPRLEQLSLAVDEEEEWIFFPFQGSRPPAPPPYDGGGGCGGISANTTTYYY